MRAALKLIVIITHTNSDDSTDKVDLLVHSSGLQEDGDKGLTMEYLQAEMMQVYKTVI